MNTRKSLFAALALVASVLVSATLSGCGGGGGGSKGSSPLPTSPITVTMSMSDAPPAPFCGTETSPGVIAAGSTIYFNVDVVTTSTIEVLVESEGALSTTRMPVALAAGSHSRVPIGVKFNSQGTLARVYPRVDNLGVSGSRAECWAEVK